MEIFVKEKENDKQREKQMLTQSILAVLSPGFP